MSFFRRAKKVQARDPARSAVPYKILKSLASVMVPAHGFVAGTVGLASSGGAWRNVRGQIWTFFKSLIRGCLWAAGIAGGMLIYSTFTQKWKEKGYPTIPISALVAADQVMSAQRQATIPMGGSGNVYAPNGVRPQTSTTSRQVSLLDLDEFEG